MEGTILDFNSETGEGLIRGEDKERYTFTKAEWKSEKSPKAQMTVDFEVTDNQAVQVYALGGKGFDMPNVNMNGMKDKFSGARDSVSGNATVKKILDHGVFNKLSLVFIIIALFGTFSDTLTLGDFGRMLGSDGAITGTSLSSFGIGWLLVLGLIALSIGTAIGFPAKIVRYVGIACIALFIWQGYSMIDQVIQLGRMMGNFGPRSDEFFSVGSIIFVVVSFIMLVIGTFLPKKESPAFSVSN